MGISYPETLTQIINSEMFIPIEQSSGEDSSLTTAIMQPASPVSLQSQQLWIEDGNEMQDTKGKQCKNLIRSHSATAPPHPKLLDKPKKTVDRRYLHQGTIQCQEINRQIFEGFISNRVA